MQEITNPGISNPTPTMSSQVGHARRQPGREPIRYGLPCANCRLYYAADLPVCPTCHCAERVCTSCTVVRSVAVM
jgi:hypothetical protein